MNFVGARFYATLVPAYITNFPLKIVVALPPTVWLALSVQREENRIQIASFVLLRCLRDARKL